MRTVRPFITLQKETHRLRLEMSNTRQELPHKWVSHFQKDEFHLRVVFFYCI